MTVSNQQGIVNVTAAVTTNAVANTQKTQTAVAAPAAGQRFRLYVATIAFDLTSATPAAGTVISAKINAGGQSYVLAIDYPNHPSASLVIPQGVPMTAANALRLLDASNIATVPYMYGLGYVQETV